MNEKEEDAIGAMFRQAMPDDLPPAVAERLERRLTAFRERFDAEGNELPNHERPWLPITRWIGGLTMRQRIAVGGTGVAAVLGLVLLWIASTGKPVSAMEQMAESIRHAKSCTLVATMEIKFVREPGKPPVTGDSTEKLYWLAPKSYRMELKGGQFTAGQDTTEIFPAGKAGLHIDHKTKKFRREPARLGPESPLMMLDKLGRFSGQADRKLGTKEINDKKAWGFEIDGKKIDPDANVGPMEIWLAADSNLPVALRYEVESPGMAAPIVIRMENFEWNTDLDPRLFDPTPPEGYTDETRKSPPLAEQVRKISDGLKTYAEASGGHYPRVKIVYGDATRDELIKMLKIPWPPRSVEQMRDENVAKVMKATEGFGAITLIFRHNPDAAYYGKTVGPKDKDKVLLRWKLDDGRYEVIFGDLHSEIVTAERLRTLEAM